MAAKKALIVGASRGLGLGLVTALSHDGWQVTATVRDPQRAEALKKLDNVQIEQLDIDNMQAINALHQRLNADVFDLVFINAGIKGPDDQTSGAASLADEPRLAHHSSNRICQSTGQTDICTHIQYLKPVVR